MFVPRSQARSQRGALMAAALMLMLVSGLLLSSWVTLMSTRAIQVSYMENAVKRRIALESSRHFAWQCIHEKAFDPNSDLGSLEGFLGGTAGGLSTGDGWSGLNIYTSTATAGTMDKVFPFNYSGLRPATPFLNTQQLVRPASLNNVDQFSAYSFLKTYPPVLGNDLFITYRKSDTAPTEIDIHKATPTTNAQEGHNGLWTVAGRTVIRHPESLFARTTPSPLQIPSRSRSLFIQSHDPYNSRAILGTNLTGERMLPSNLAAPPTTSGPVSNTASDRFEGYLDVIRNDRSPDNSLWHFMEREQAAGRSSYVTIDVFSKSATATGPYWMDEQKGNAADLTYPPPGWPSGYGAYWRVLFIQLDHPDLPHMRIHGVVDQIIFKGQSTVAAFENAGAMSPVIFTTVPMNAGGPAVRFINFEHENNRRMVLGVKHWNRVELDLSWVGAPISGAEFNWRTVMVNESHTVMVNMPSNVTQAVRWIGGVMTNWTFKRRNAGGINASRLNFVSDASVPTLTPAGPAFATLLPRDAWLESYFLPALPPPEPVPSPAP